MRAWIASHWRVAAASTTVVALVAGLGVWAVVQLSPQAVDCSSLEATSFSEANVISQACGEDVEVLAERTPWQTSYATADNASRLVVTTIPSRVLVDGEWVPMDPTLVVDEKAGTIEVAAPVNPTELNAGGSAGRDKPLGSITTDEHQLDVWFPLDLPVPEISDTQAVYDLGDGIRLLMSVNVDATGFLPVVELADAAAAARFTELLDAARAANGGVSAGLDIEYATDLSEGLTLSLDETGAVHARDVAGETQFTSAAPLMWDSAGGDLTLSPETTEVGLADRTRSPADGDQIAAMGVTLAETTIVVSPDDAMMQDPETVWPVYLDPGFGTVSPSKWVAVRTGGYTSTLVNWGDISTSMLGQGTGYCTHSSCNTVFYQRLVWQFSGLTGLAALTGAEVTAAMFNVDGQHSYDCSAQTTTLYRTSDIGGFGTGSNWGAVSWLQALGSRAEAHSNSCANKGFRGFDALAGAQWAADNDSSVLNLGLAVGEANMTPWKRFRHNANLVIDYNRPPNTPTNAQFTSPQINSCVTGDGRPSIATTRPTIAVTSSDPDLTSVTTRFQVEQAELVTFPSLPTLPPILMWQRGAWSSPSVAPMASGSQQALMLPAVLSSRVQLVDGGVYRWRAEASDGTLTSPWSSWCEFRVDLSAPLVPSISPVTSGVVAVYSENVPGGGVGQAGKFTLSRGGATQSADVVSFSYGFNDPLTPNSALADSTGKAVINFPAPTTTGLVTLTVKSKDAAGNFSPMKQYKFTVASPTADGIWTLDQGTGTTAADTAGNPARPLSIVSGVTWVGGPHALFGSRPGDKALNFNGTSQYASTTAQVVDTLNSFVVSGFVKLNTTHGVGPFTALSQSGATQSGFQLGYAPAASCPGATTDCWTFSMPNSASGSSTSVFSTVPVTEGEWTYLVGEHNAATHTLRLWVCEIGTPEDPAVGEPVRSQATRSGAAWAAAGVFNVGRAQTAGAASNYWPGAIDNVRVFSGDVLAESKIRRMCQGAEATDFGGVTAELDPSIAATP